MRDLAAEGRTVFVSSHLMSEMEHTADHLLVIGRGRLIADCTVSEFIERNSQLAVRVRSPQAAQLVEAVRAAGDAEGRDTVVVTELTAERIGDLAFEHGIRLYELAPVQASLEQAFMELTRDSVEYHSTVSAERREAV